MSSVLASLVVTGIFLGVAAVVGYRLGRLGNPYGYVRPAIHVMLFILVLSGVTASLYKLQQLPTVGQSAQISLCVTVLTLLTNLTVGIRMMIMKSANTKLVAIHKLSTLVMAITLILSILLVTAEI